MPIKAEQLPASLERNLAPVYLIGGEEPLLLQECCDQVRAAAAGKGYLERELLLVEAGFDWSSLQQAAAPSLFASRKLIDLRLKTGKPGREGAKQLVEFAQAGDTDTVLMVSCERWDASSRKSKWAAVLAKIGVQVDIWPIQPSQLPGWLSRRMQQQGMQPEPGVVELLAERLEGNLLAARQEIDRLALLKGAGRISVDDVIKAVADSSRFDAFALAEHLLAGQLQAGLRAAAGLRRMDTPIPLVLGALFRELKTAESFRLAMRGGESENIAFKRLNIWFKRQQLIRAAARRIDTLMFFTAYKHLSLIDKQSKGRAEGDPWQGIDALLRQLS